MSRIWSADSWARPNPSRWIAGGPSCISSCGVHCREQNRVSRENQTATIGDIRIGSKIECASELFFALSINDSERQPPVQAGAQSDGALRLLLVGSGYCVDVSPGEITCYSGRTECFYWWGWAPDPYPPSSGEPSVGGGTPSDPYNTPLTDEQVSGARPREDACDVPVDEPPRMQRALREIWQTGRRCDRVNRLSEW